LVLKNVGLVVVEPGKRATDAPLKKDSPEIPRRKQSRLKP
jgi:hypothetical protein